MNDCEALNSTKELTPDSVKGEAGTNCDIVNFDGEEPTEEEVANAMRQSNASSNEASPTDENQAGVSEEVKVEGTTNEASNDAQADESGLCPICGSNDDPQFIHYRRISKQPVDSTYGAFIWRYCCARKECAEFFGDYYAYDKVTNSFVQIPEGSTILEEIKVDCETQPSQDDAIRFAVADGSLEAEDVTDQLPNRSPEEQPSSVSSAEQSSSVPADELPPSLPSDEQLLPLAAQTESQSPAVLPDDQSPNEPHDEQLQQPLSVAADDQPSSVPCDESEAPSDNTAETSATPGCQKGRRRQKQTSRKKTAPFSKTKASSDSKKVGNSGSNKPKDSSSRSPSKRRKSNLSDPTKSELTYGPKKPRKGYVYEVVPVQPPPLRNPLAINSLISNGYGLSNTNECGTQTMGGAHFFSILIDQLINGQAELCTGSTTDEPVSLPSYVSRRLMITQQLLKRQSDELDRVQEENKRLHSVLNLMNSVIRKFGDEYTSELRRLRDTVGVLKGEFSFYQEEFVAEAKKSIDNISAQKEEIQRKIDDVERKNRLLSTRIDLHIKEKEAVEERADGYLREISARDRDVILANKARDRAERKLNDTLYVANNAKCAHCQISDKMRAHLTDVVAEKTVLLEKCRKECVDLQRRADHSDRISKILSKDSEKLKFELNTWKSDAERNISEIARLKEELRKVSSGQLISKPRDKVEKQSAFASSPALSGSDGKSGTPTDSAGSHTQEEQNNSPGTVARATCSVAVQVVPVMPTPPEDPDSPFSSWLPKDRKVNSSPPVSFFNPTPIPTKRQASAFAPARKSIPFNGPVITDRSISKQVATMASPISAEGAKQPRSAEARNDRIPANNRDDGTSGTTEAPIPAKDTAPRFFNMEIPNKIRPAVEQPAVYQGVLPRKEPRKRKSSIVDYLESVDASRSAIPAAIPFNGPISLSCANTVSPSRSVQQNKTETERIRFSSSPLPWHRGESYNEGTVEQSPPRNPFENRSMYDKDLLPGKPTAQRVRKNFWEP